jgi:hypothetical protein
MQAAVRTLDKHMRRRLGIVEFSDNPDCLFRVCFTPAYRDLQLHDVTVAQGAPIAEVHWWNEHLPKMGTAGLDMKWAVAMRRKLLVTHREMAQQLKLNPNWQAVQAVGTTTAMFPASDASWVRKMKRMGYEVSAHGNSGGATGEFFERIWAWMIWRTYQAGTLRVLSPFAIERSDFWMSAANLLHVYGENKPAGG